jgi:hypothetical protein
VIDVALAQFFFAVDQYQDFQWQLSNLVTLPSMVTSHGAETILLLPIGVGGMGGMGDDPGGGAYMWAMAKSPVPLPLILFY